jgi:hypothetical protein
VADEAADWLVRFADPLFAYFKIASFVVLELLLVVNIAMIRGRVKMGKTGAE